MLVFDRVPLEHTTCKHTIAVFVVSDNFVNTRNTSSNSTTWCFDNLLENSEVEVVKETNRNVDWITRKTLNHFDDG